MDHPLRILIADDHPVVCDGLRVLLESVEGMSVVGTANNGSDAIEFAHRLSPDLVITDLKMGDPNKGDIDGIEVTRRIVSDNPEIGVVVLTMFDDDDTVLDAMSAGARGYLLKGAEQEEILRAIDAVVNGETILGQGLATRILGRLGHARDHAEPSPFPYLTPRELQVLDLLAGGRNNSAIAKELGLSVKTVANNLSNIFVKIQVSDRGQAIVRARDAGLG